VGPGPLEESGALIGADLPALAIRAFFALPIPDAHRQLLRRHLALCAAGAPGFRWVAPENLHLTLRFMGHVDRELALGIADRLASRRLVAAQLELGELGTFTRGRLVRVVWAGLRTGALAAQELAAAVEAECAGAGLPPEARAFAPHLTLARSRERFGAPLPELPALPRLDPWLADELVLFQSQLGRPGATYEPLVRIPLSASA
jgi:RNA 2',3'-cyclic 3'-phosphodiesterase